MLCTLLFCSAGLSEDVGCDHAWSSPALRLTLSSWHPLGSLSRGKTWAVVSAGAGGTSLGPRPPRTSSFLPGSWETSASNILHGKAFPALLLCTTGQRHSLVLFVTDQCIYPCGKMSLPPGLGFSVLLNRSRCAGEGLANCLFSQVAPGDGCPAARRTAHAGHGSRQRSRGLPPVRASPLPNKWTLSCRSGPRGSSLHLPSWAKETKGGSLKKRGMDGPWAPS